MTERLTDEELRHAIRSAAEPLREDEIEAISEYLYGKRQAVAGITDADVARRLIIEVERLHEELLDATDTLIVADRMIAAERRVSDFLFRATGLDRGQIETVTGWLSLEDLADELGVDLDAIRDEREAEEKSDEE